MQTIGLIANHKKQDALAHLKDAAVWLGARGVLCLADDKTAKAVFAGYDTKPPESFDICPREELFTKTDALIIFGGDGTMLDIAANAGAGGVPVLGVNLGQVGYLTDTEPQHLTDALGKWLNNRCKIENRMMLKADVNGSMPDNTQYLALNEFCVSKGVGTHMISFDIYLNGAYINTCRADGVLAATPTGSTAYNLSAGGPVLKPDGDMIAITPICPHGLFALPCVVSGRDVITARLPADGASALLSADGRFIAQLEPGARVTVQMAEKPLRIIKTNDLSFFDVLRKKMGN